MTRLVLAIFYPRIDVSSWRCVSAVMLAISIIPTYSIAGPMVQFTEYTRNVAAATSTRGWEFNVLATNGIRVTHLGFWDEDANGLGIPHDVGIWNSAGDLLGSTIVPSGIQAPLDANGLFRMVDVEDFTLAFGNGYRIGALYLGNAPDAQAIRVEGLTISPEIQYVRSRSINNFIAQLTFPTGTLSTIDPGYFGPTFDAIAIPEPASFILFISGFLPIGIFTSYMNYQLNTRMIIKHCNR